VPPRKSIASRLILLAAINRLDRLTSGLMIIPLSAERASSVSKEFMNGTIRKEYIARCKGEFSASVLRLGSVEIFYVDIFF
jgi:23S rRNA-/tRNA-specific pseudouridylate synthase